MRAIVQPGPGPAERIQWVEARGRRFVLVLEPGLTLLEAIRQGFAREGFASGVVALAGGALGPFAYVMPALSETGENAAFYSAIFRPAGVARLETGALTFGSRDGQPFFHCHALWREADGRRNGGHIMPDETVVAERFEVTALGLSGAAFEAHPDPETAFKLFGPVPAMPTKAVTDRRVFALRLRPNQDTAGALEQFCRDQGIARARLHGGVGSIIGARFDDGRVMEPFATEIAVLPGEIAPGSDGGLEAGLDIVLVDYTGGMAEGRLRRGDNPVLMTLEIVLEAV